MTVAAARSRGLPHAELEAIVGVGEDGRIVLINEQTELLFGYAPGELIGQAVELLVPESARAAHRKHRAAYFAQPVTRGVGSGLHLVGRRKDGSEFPAEITLSMIETEHGVVAWAAIGDLAARERADERFQGQLEEAPDAIVAVDDDGRIALVNAQTEELFGYAHGELIGQPVEVLVPDPDQSTAPDRAYVADPLTRPEGSGLEMAGRRKDGSEFQAEISLSAIDTDDGLLVSAAVVDVSERRQAALTASSSDLILSIALDGTVISCNPAAEQLRGGPASEAIGQNIDDLFGAAHIDAMRSLIDRLVAGEQFEEYEITLDGPDGATVDFALTLAPMVDASDDIVGVSVIGRDLTDRRVAETQRRVVDERVGQARRLESLGQLAGGIAHDFNNLLAVILNYASFVAEEVADNPGARADVEQISAAAERATRLVHQLLIFGRQDTVKQQVLGLNEIVTEVQDMLSRTLGEHIEMAVRLQSDLPSIRADRSQMEQVVVNLALNARDAMPDGGVLTIETGSVDLDAEYAQLHPPVRPGPHVRLSVSDTGTGMTRDVRDRVFEPFFTTKAKGFGTGLGLATVYGVVLESGGSMSLYSEMGLGTTVSVVLPVLEGGELASTVAKAPSAAAGGGRRILVVEDEDAMRKVTARMLRRNHYTVFEAATGEEALTIAGERELDLVLSDVVMPQMSGRELAERLNGLDPALPVVFMSGYSQGVLRPQRMLPEDVYHLQKPFDRSALLNIVDAAMAKST